MGFLSLVTPHSHLLTASDAGHLQSLWSFQPCLLLLLASINPLQAGFGVHSCSNCSLSSDKPSCLSSVSPTSFNVGTANPFHPFNFLPCLPEQPVLITPPCGIFAVQILPLNPKVHGPPLSTASAPFCRISSFSSVMITFLQIIYTASDSFSSFVPIAYWTLLQVEPYTSSRAKSSSISK